MNWQKCALISLVCTLAACASAPQSVQALPPEPKPVAPAAAMASIPEAGWFAQTLDEILKR